jgi:hypothetical protein
MIFQGKILRNINIFSKQPRPNTRRRHLDAWICYFFLGGRAAKGVSIPLVSRDVAATGPGCLSVFGFRVSRLLRFCPLAMLASSSVPSLQ